MYTIVSWDTCKILDTSTTLSRAKRKCRKLGHLSENNGAWYYPIAYVADKNGGMVYNPRFKVSRG